MCSKNSRGYNEEEVPETKRMLKLQAPLVWTTWLLVGEKNAARGLKRKMLNGSHSPDFYYADIELHDPKLEENREVSLPFLLPNEIAGKLFEFGDPTWILSRQVLQEDAELIEKFSSSCQPARDPATVLPLGLWNDGVPCNWDRSQSLEVIALSFPSIPGLRVPLFCLKKMFEAKKCSMDAALKVLVWSFEQLAVGRYRSRRHDGSPFDARVDKARIRLAGLELPSACLTQIRGDWKMFKVIRLDWLHIMDLGCAADAAGNVLWLLQSKLPGPNIAKRVGEVFTEILEEYKNQGVTSDRLATLTETMFRKDAASAPKVKAKGAETRKLIPILGALCRKLLDSTRELDSAVVACMSLLLQCCAALDVEPYDPNLMEREVRRFALQYVSLRDYYSDNITWRVKPKLHLLLHLSQSSTCPKDTWCYRDEDFGGATATMVRAKGGHNTPGNSSQVVLDKFKARNDPPVLAA
ncbi:unnamed protein product [Symbiodinium sp. KB8]|nr:unnamed protein product [Symbiodinium sp. KB8]